MKIVCAWCGKVIKETDTDDKNEEVSHGICPDCYKKMKELMKEEEE